MKKPYEKPFIHRSRGGVANKFGGLAHTRVMPAVEGIPVAELVEKYGSPLFVFSEKVIRAKHAELIQAFSRRYPKVQHAWSYKTNYLKGICRTMHCLGSWAEVVSAMEYEMALNNGVAPARIVFNGPYKPYDILKRALQDGAMVNMDSMDELYDAERIAADMGQKAAMGLRVNMGLGSHAAWDRFGFNLDDGSAMQALKRALAGGKIRIIGLHAHIGTFILDPDLYRRQVTKLIQLCRTIQDEFGLNMEYLDIGGGFASRNRLKGTYLSTADMAPAFEAYAEAVCDPILNGFAVQDLPLLLLESGRAMIDEAGSLITTVAAVKRLTGGLRGVVLDAGVNLLFTAFWYDHEVFPTVERGRSPVEHVLYGPLCMQIDVIREQIKLPHLEKGDQVVIRPVGAYNNTQWLQFIHLRPNVVMIGENGTAAVIRKAESVEYLQEQECLPPWLE